MEHIVDERIKELFGSSVNYYFEECFNYIEPIAKALMLVSEDAYAETFGRMRDYCVNVLFYIFAKSFKEPFDDMIYENNVLKDYFYDIMYEGEDATHIDPKGKNTFYTFDVNKFYNEVFEILAEEEMKFKEEIFNG